MAIKHTYRYVLKGGAVRNDTKEINRSQAIRIACRECMGGSCDEIQTCQTTLCALWPFRNGPGKIDYSLA
jgi:hypothetical protein